MPLIVTKHIKQRFVGRSGKDLPGAIVILEA
jgi:hypothetical protein